MSDHETPEQAAHRHKDENSRLQSRAQAAMACGKRYASAGEQDSSDGGGAQSARAGAIPATASGVGSPTAVGKPEPDKALGAARHGQEHLVRQGQAGAR